MGGVGTQKDVGFLGGQLRMAHDVAQEDKRRDRVGKGIVPAEVGKGASQILLQAEIVDEIAERKRPVLWPDGAGKLEGIHPGPKTVEGKGAQEAFFGSGAMGDEPAAMEEAAKIGPEVGQSRCVGKILRADAVDFSCGPGDRLVREEKAGKRLRDLEPVHQRDADLHGHLGTSSSHTRAFEVEGGKGGLRNDHSVPARRSPVRHRPAHSAYGWQVVSRRSVISQSMHESVMETPYFRAWGSLPSDCPPK